MGGVTFPVEIGSCTRPVERWNGEAVSGSVDLVAEEVPVALAYNGVSHAVMLATPTDLEDFAVGFSLSEVIIASVGELRDLEVARCEDGITVDISIAPARFAALKDRRRNLTGRTGCGICGTESLAQAIRRPPRVASAVSVEAEAIHRALADIGEMQTLNAATGALHAAAWVSAAGAIELLREDVGRHNALDKLIGARASIKRGFAEGFALITSRASYEMVQKAATVGIEFVVAISAPTGLAIRLAGETGVTLVGFARRGSHVVYANPHRVCRAMEKMR